MFSLLDFIIAGSLAVGAYLGYRKGLAPMLLSLIGTVVGLVAGFSFYDNLGRALAGVAAIRDGLTSFISGKLPIPQEVAAMPINNYPFDIVRGMIASEHLPKTYENIVLDFITQLKSFPETQGINSIAGGITYLILEMILKIAAFILIFTVVSMAVRWLGRGMLTKKIFAPVDMVSKIGGLCVGFLFSLVNTALLLIVLTLTLSVIGAGREGGLLAVVNKAMENSFIIRFLLKFFGIDWA